MAAFCAGVYSMPDRMNAAPSVGTSELPTALKDWAKLMRRSAVSGGPRTVTYGLAQTSRKDWPDDMTKRASRKNAYCREVAAGRKSSVPAEQIKRPRRMPRL